MYKVWMYFSNKLSHLNYSLTRFILTIEAMFNTHSFEDCPACQSQKITVIEQISTLKIAQFWSQFESNAGCILKNYIEEGKIPSQVQIFQCHECRLEFGNPMFAVDDDWYSKFERYGFRWEFNQCLMDLPSTKAKILEIGCGEGYFLELASLKGYHAIGIDFNSSAIKVAKNKGLEAYTYDIKQLNADSHQRFDSVAFFHVVEHLDDLENFFKELALIMPLASTLHFSCPSPRRFTTHLELAKKVGLRDVWDYPPFHQSRWNRKAADKLLSRFGWKLEKYLEEPFHWLGTSSFLASEELAKKISNYQISSLGNAKL